MESIIIKRPKSNLFLERFERGLFNHYKLTLEELLKNYKYCGGDGDNGSGDKRHYNYWVLNFGDKDFPYKESECFCGQQIRENCFVVDKTKKNFVHMGNCCIKRFMPENKSGRTCEICENSHKNRKYNLCNDCKEINKKCVNCNKYFKFIYKTHIYCNECYEEIKIKREEEMKRKQEREKEKKRRENEEIQIQMKKIIKGFINSQQIATKIKEIKVCTECNNTYETYNAINTNSFCNACKEIKKKQKEEELQKIKEENMKISEENIRIREENIKKEQSIGLTCYCKLPSVLREVKKDGPNKGKLFYCCRQYYDEKCDYFMWKNDNSKMEEEINEHPICYCKLPSVLREVKKDGPNNGKMFYTCSKKIDDKCKYFVWK